MAFSKPTNDKSAIRHDFNSLFGGSYIRDDVDDSQVFNLDLVTGSLTFTDLGETYRVVYKAASNSGYSGILDTGIAVRTDYSGEVSATGNSSANDFMLDWGRARFNSISLETKRDGNWIVGYQYSMTGNLSQALPNRGTTDSSILQDIKNSITEADNATYINNFYNSWEYQCALYNWQFPVGSSLVQYLFGDDNLNGTRLDDVMTGGAGNDTINGGVGDDILYGSFGADTLYGAAGNDVIYFDGGSSVWNYKTLSAGGGRGAYTSRTIDQASGGTGKDYFVFELPSFFYTSADEMYPDLPDLYNRPGGTVTKYNPFLSQSHDGTPFSNSPTAYGVSPLTFRTRILDFKVGEDKLDLTEFGIDLDFINTKLLAKNSGAAFITAANIVLKNDGYSLALGKSSATSNNTTLFIREAGIDTNDNQKINDTLVEIQLVGLTTSSISVKIFGDAPES